MDSQNQHIEIRRMPDYSLTVRDDFYMVSESRSEIDPVAGNRCESLSLSHKRR
jgi:hypothetical protein